MVHPTVATSICHCREKRRQTVHLTVIAAVRRFLVNTSTAEINTRKRAPCRFEGAVLQWEQEEKEVGASSGGQKTPHPIPYPENESFLQPCVTLLATDVQDIYSPEEGHLTFVTPALLTLKWPLSLYVAMSSNYANHFVKSECMCLRLIIKITLDG